METGKEALLELDVLAQEVNESHSDMRFWKDVFMEQTPMSKRARHQLRTTAAKLERLYERLDRKIAQLDQEKGIKCFPFFNKLTARLSLKLPVEDFSMGNRELFALALHAMRCQNKDNLNQMNAQLQLPPLYKKCEDVFCASMKQILRHQMDCDMCQDPRCLKVHLISKHLRDCASASCQFCGPAIDENNKIIALEKAPINLHLCTSESIFSGYTGPDPFSGVSNELRKHLVAQIEAPMIPQAGHFVVDIAHNMDLAKAMEAEAFKEARSALEYYGRVVLKIDMILKDLRGTYNHTRLWQPMVPIITRHRYTMRIFNFLQLGNVIRNEEELHGVLRMAQEIEDFHFRAAARMRNYFKRVNGHAQVLLKAAGMV